MLNDSQIAHQLNRVFWADPMLINVKPEPSQAQLQPASLDLRLGDVAKDMVVGANYWCLEAGEFILASTLETVTLGSQISARVEGKSTWGRRGLMIHCAGFIDPGFSGQITLEFKNLSHRPLHVRPEDTICQLAFFRLSYPALRPYGSPGIDSRYQGQSGPTPAIPDNDGE